MLNYFLLRLVGPKMGELKVHVPITSYDKPYSQYICHDFLSIIYIILITHRSNYFKFSLFFR